MSSNYFFHLNKYFLVFILLLSAWTIGAETVIPPKDQLVEAARSGDVTSQLRLADACLRGIGRPVNALLARYWFYQAAQSGHKIAIYHLALCYIDGIGGDKLPNAAFHLLEPLISEIPAARVLYANLLFNGIPPEKSNAGEFPAVQPSKQRATAILEEIAGHDRAAQLMLIKLYYSDTPKFQRQLRRILIIHCSLPNPDPEALLLYSACLRSGIGGDVDIKSGIQILERAASGGSSEATAQLAELYLNGEGVPANADKAMELLTQVEPDSPRAQVMLGDLYMYGNHVKTDLSRAFKYFHKAAQTGYPPALCKIGICYRDGLGVERNAKEAFENFKIAASTGDAEAIYQLGKCFRDGIGISPNLKLAQECFRLAAANGHTKAQRIIDSGSAGI